MLDSKLWESPDKKIKKEILVPGSFGGKPTENSICVIEISSAEPKLDSNLQSEYVSTKNCVTVNIGEANTALDREIDKCLQTMNKEESSKFVINIFDKDVSLVIKLRIFESRGLIFEWDANDKCVMAQKHKEKGVQLFKEGRYADASHRFSKGLKLILSIPVPVDKMPDEIDNVDIKEIDGYKTNLYSNLACCYSKVKSYEKVIELCTKVLTFDNNNVKAFHNRGIAYAGVRDFEKSKEDLTKVLEFDSKNKSAQDKLRFVNLHLYKQEANYNNIVKKMFGN